MTLTDTNTPPLERWVDPGLQKRLDRIQELHRLGAVGAQTVFGMLFFHGIESGVKTGCLRPGGRAAYDAVKDTLRQRTMTRGHAHAFSLEPGNSLPVLDESAWSDRGLFLQPASKAGFTRLIEASANAAGEAAGLAAPMSVQRAMLDFVRMGTSVTAPADKEGQPPVELGGYPDSAHFFSFAELSLSVLEDDPTSTFWLELARGAVAAQPIYLAIQFLSGRRVPRAVTDYGPNDLLGHPRELERRLGLAPEPEDLSGACPRELARLVGRNVHRGFLG